MPGIANITVSYFLSLFSCFIISFEYTIEMNYLDLVPNDVINIINRDFQNIQIIQGRIERKQNRKMNRDQKEIAEHTKRYLYEQSPRLYHK